MHSGGNTYGYVIGSCQFGLMTALELDDCFRCCWNCLFGFGNAAQCLMVQVSSEWGKQCSMLRIFTVRCLMQCMGNSLVRVRYVGVWEKVWSVQGMCLHLLYVGLVYLMGYLVSKVSQVRLFTLRFSFVAHQFRFYLGFKLGIFFIKFSLLPGLFNKNIIFKKCYMQCMAGNQQFGQSQ